MKSTAVTVIATLLLLGIAYADTNVGGWNVSSKPDNGVCTADRHYKDSEDDNKENAVVFGLVRDSNALVLIVNFSYADWKFDKDEKIQADLLIDGKTVLKQSKWKGNNQGLTASFADGDDILNKFGNGKKVVLHFSDGDAIFFTPNAGMAIGAVQQCLDAK